MIKNDHNQLFPFQRSLILKNINTNKCHKFNCQFYFSKPDDGIDCYHTLHHLRQVKPQIDELLAEAQLFYVNPEEQTKIFIGNYPLRESIIVEYHQWKEPEIVLEFRGKERPEEPERTGKTNGTLRRAGERTIQQALNYLQLWAQQMEYQQSIGRKMLMAAAAKAIGFSKKTLDDYSRCIRYGEQLGFDIQGRSKEKISVLRKYVKESRHLGEESEEKKIDDPDAYWQASYFKTSD